MRLRHTRRACRRGPSKVRSRLKQWSCHRKNPANRPGWGDRTRRLARAASHARALARTSPEALCTNRRGSRAARAQPRRQLRLLARHRLARAQAAAATRPRDDERGRPLPRGRRRGVAPAGRAHGARGGVDGAALSPLNTPAGHRARPGGSPASSTRMRAALRGGSRPARPARSVRPSSGRRGPRCAPS